MTKGDAEKLKVKIGRSGNLLIIEFEKDTRWIGLTYKDALDLGNSVVRFANEIKKEIN